MAALADETGLLHEIFVALEAAALKIRPLDRIVIHLRADAWLRRDDASHPRP